MKQASDDALKTMQRKDTKKNSPEHKGRQTRAVTIQTTYWAVRGSCRWEDTPRVILRGYRNAETFLEKKGVGGRRMGKGGRRKKGGKRKGKEGRRLAK